MFKKKKKEEVTEEAPAPAPVAEAEKPAKKFPALPIGDSAAAGLIAVIFAAVGILLCVKTCNAANATPKEKKAKKEKKAEK